RLVGLSASGAHRRPGATAQQDRGRRGHGAVRRQRRLQRPLPGRRRAPPLIAASQSAGLHWCHLPGRGDTMHEWEAILTPADQELYKTGLYGARQQFRSHPALLIVDVTRSFVGSKPMPILEAVKEYAT